MEKKDLIKKGKVSEEEIRYSLDQYLDLEKSANQGHMSHQDVHGPNVVMVFGKHSHTLIETTIDWNDDLRGHNIIGVVRHGIRFTEFNKLYKRMPFALEEWAHYLSTTTRTLERYRKENKLFKIQHSERIIEINQLYRKGLEVFGAASPFDEWMHTENLALGKIRPSELLDTSFGIRMVLDELGRIEHGTLA